MPSEITPMPLPLVESNQVFITRMVQTYQSRTPTDTEIASWDAQLTNGTTREALEYSFKNPKTSETDSNFVTRMAQLYLERMPSSDELNAWVRQLASGTSRSALEYSFAHTFKTGPDGIPVPMPLSIPIVGGLLDGIGAVALQIPLLGSGVGLVSDMTGVSPGVVTIVGSLLALYMFGAFDGGSKRQ